MRKTKKKKGPSAIGVTLDTLYRVACETFKEQTGKKPRCKVYTELAVKFEYEYGFPGDDVMRVMDKAAAWADENYPCPL